MKFYISLSYILGGSLIDQSSRKVETDNRRR